MPGLDQAANLVGDDAGFARAGPGQHQAGAVQVIDGFLLGQVQAGGGIGRGGGHEGGESGSGQARHCGGRRQESYRRRVARLLQPQTIPQNTGDQYNENSFSTHDPFCMALPKSFPLCGLVLAFGVATGACAAPNPAFDCGAKPIRLAFYEFGYFYFDKNRGIDVDVVNELMRRTGCKFDTQVMTRARIWADLASGELDMSVSGIRNPERDKFAGFANYLSMKNYALVQKNAASRVRRAEEFVELKGLQFGVVRAFKHGEKQDQWLDKLRQEQRVQESPDVETVFRKLKEQRVDAMFSQPPVYRRNMAVLGMQNEVMVQDWTPGEKGVPHGLILSKRRFSQADVARWQALLNEMRADGTLNGIFAQYLPPDEAGKMLDY
jgi:polar amino acid transport system substrate-binding protein